MLSKINRLKKRKEFNYIYKKGQVAHAVDFSVHFVRAFKPYAQIGISVSKTVGNSVVRSRVKRIISEACRLNINKFAVKNYVITAKPPIVDKKSTDIETELLALLKKNHLLNEFEQNGQNLRAETQPKTAKQNLNKSGKTEKQNVSFAKSEQTANLKSEQIGAKNSKSGKADKQNLKDISFVNKTEKQNLNKSGKSEKQHSAEQIAKKADAKIKVQRGANGNKNV